MKVNVNIMITLIVRDQDEWIWCLQGAVLSEPQLCQSLCSEIFNLKPSRGEGSSPSTSLWPSKFRRNACYFSRFCQDFEKTF